MRKNNIKLNFTKNHRVSWFSCGWLKISECSISLTRLDECTWSCWNINWVAIAVAIIPTSITIIRLNRIILLVKNKFLYFPSNNSGVHDRKPFLGQQMQSNCFPSFASNFFCSCLIMKIASVVPLAGMKPNSSFHKIKHLLFLWKYWWCMIDASHLVLCLCINIWLKSDVKQTVTPSPTALIISLW